MFMPPVKPTTPSHTTILRWQRKSARRVRIQRIEIGLNQATWAPASRSGRRKRRPRCDDPDPSTSSRTATPARAFSISRSRRRVPIRSGSKM
jgi:hypothetical protein